MKEEFKYIGRSLPLHDVKEKVSGKIKYVGDIELPGMLYAKLVLSSIPHGRIIKIDATKSEALAGVVKIYTHENTPKGLYNSHKWFAGLEVLKDERMFTDKVRFVGDRVACVVAQDRETAERAAGLLEIQYEEFEAVVNPKTALEHSTVNLHLNGNLIARKTLECGNTSETMEKATIIVEDEIETQRVHHGAMEPHVCLAEALADGGITIYTPCQVVYQVRLIASEALGLPLNKIRVIKAPMGGSFGGKGQPILEPICGYIAMDLGLPVKLQMDRTEAIIGTRTRNATIGIVRTAVDQQGHILARDIKMLVNAGAYATNGEAVTIAMGKKCFRLYKIPNQSYVGEAVYTNTPIGGACRGYGSPQIHAITEINIDNTARRVGMDPVEFRLKNLMEPYDKDPIGGPELGNIRIIDCVKLGMNFFNWREKYQGTKRQGRFVKGVGMACGVHGNGYFGAYQDFITMDIRMTEDGEIILKAGIHDLGCGTVTTMKQIIAEVLELPIEKIMVPEGDTLTSPYDSAGTQASRVTFVCGNCAKIITEKLREKFINRASEILNSSEGDIVLESEKIWSKEEPTLKYNYGDMVILIQQHFKEDISVNFTYQSPANPAASAANFVEVEVDTLTGLVKVLKVVAVHDIGKAINLGFVEGQVQGAIQMGIGFALTEEIQINEAGRILNDNFSKYHVINAPDMPDVEVLLIEEGEEHGPFGAKSVGEIATVPIAPAIVNAVNHALNVNLTSLPITPDKILKALNEKI